MEDEELSEEVMGDPDNEREVTEDLQHDKADAGEPSGSEEPMHQEEPCMEDYKLQQEISVLQEQIKGLNAAISTIIESGATIVEQPTPTTDMNEDSEEPYVYLEDMDFTM